jgi:hypothetical protein
LALPVRVPPARAPEQNPTPRRATNLVGLLGELFGEPVGAAGAGTPSR